MLVAIGAVAYGLMSGALIVALCRAAGRHSPSDEAAARRGRQPVRLGKPSPRSARG
jgi:hypothetical protein